LKNYKTADDVFRQPEVKDYIENGDINAVAEVDHKVYAKVYPPKYQSLQIPKEVKNLSAILKKDNFSKENLNMIRAFFIECQFTDDGLAATIDFENKIRNANTTLSWSAVDSLITLITSKKDSTKVSYFKLKSLIQTLEEDRLHDDMQNSMQMKKLITESLEPMNKPSNLTAAQELEQAQIQKSKPMNKEK
jgi:hypothetical protein